MLKRITFFCLILPLLISSCGSEDNITPGITFKVEYGGEPLIMFKDYDYQDVKLSFSRYSFFLSDVALIDGDNVEPLTEIDYLNFTSTNVDEAGAKKGIAYNYDIKSRPYKKLRFRIGVSASDNAQTPADFPSSNPLSKSGEYWAVWDSYIFSKMEGLIDTGDPIKTGFSLHTGGQDAEVVVESNVEGIDTDGKQNIVVTIDLKDVLSKEKVYDIVNNPAIHRRDQIEEVQILVNNLKKSIKVERN